MFSRDGTVLFKSGGHECPPGEVVCPSKQATRSLLDGQNGLFGEEMFFDSSDLEMVIQVSLHVFKR